MSETPEQPRNTSVPTPIRLCLAAWAMWILFSPKEKPVATIALDPDWPDPLAQAIGGWKDIENNQTPVTYDEHAAGVISKSQDIEGWWDDPDKKLYHKCFIVGEDAGKQNNTKAQTHIFSKVTFDAEGKQVIKDLFWCLYQYDSNGLESTEYQTALQNFCDHYNNLSYKKRIWILGIINGVLQRRYSPKEIQALQNNWFPGGGDFQTLHRGTI